MKPLTSIFRLNTIDYDNLVGLGTDGADVMMGSEIQSCPVYVLNNLALLLCTAIATGL